MDCHCQKFVLSWNGRENTILIKKFPEFIQKIQNTVLFIKSDIVPFKVFPIDCNALMPALDPARETFLELYCRYSHQSFDFSIISFRLLKHIPCNGFLTRTEKNGGAISGEFDGCWMVFVSFLLKNSLVVANSTPFLKLIRLKNRKYVQR